MVDEPKKYSSKGDFGAYNEPSWVPDGYCKCCAMIPPSLDQGETRKPVADLLPLVLIGRTEKKNLSIAQCPSCDKRSKR